MATTKYLSKEGLEHLLSKLYARGFKGLGLSQEDFTTELKSKLIALSEAGTAADLTALTARVVAVEKLIESDTDGAINKFNEIVAFLAEVGDDKTLKGLLAAKANSTDLTALQGRVSTLETDTAELKTRMSTAEGKITTAEGKITTLEGKVATIEGDYLPKGDVAVLSNAEIDSAIAANA